MVLKFRDNGQQTTDNGLFRVWCLEFSFALAIPLTTHR